MGVHIPINAPHWVKNANNVSIAVSINYHVWASERANIYRINYYLRNKLGVTPTSLPFTCARFRQALDRDCLPDDARQAERLKRSQVECSHSTVLKPLSF